MTNDIIKARTEKYESVMNMYHETQDIEPEYVITALSDVSVRDALLHTFSDKYQISLYGDEATLEDCSAERKNFGAFLMCCALSHEFTPEFWTVCSAIMLLDGEVDGAYSIADKYKDEVSLAKSITYGVEKLPKVVASLFKESVEENPVSKCLQGA